MVLLIGLCLIGALKPVHLDDANFLVLARGAAADPWRPHAISINWQGQTERAFDVLSNPPGVGYLLAPVVDLPPWIQHLWLILICLPPALWGAERLLRALAPDAPRGAGRLLLLGAPSALVAAHSLMPDLPLLACTLAGLGGVVGGAGPLARRWPWALVLGLAALFRYSGAPVAALAPAWALLHGDRRAALRLGLAAGAPLGLLLLHDQHAYGELHLLAMTRFQGVSGGARDLARKLIAAVAALGGALVLPPLALARPRGALLGAGLGLGLGALGAALSGHGGAALLHTVGFSVAGGAVLGAALLPAAGDGRVGLFLRAWLAGGLLFLLALRFTAARYWLPFAPAAALLLLRAAAGRTRLVRAAAGLTLLVSGGVAFADLQLARAQRDAAAWAVGLAPAGGDPGSAGPGDSAGPGVFAGHWGWQHHLEAAGWAPIEDDGPLPVGRLFARSDIAWSQDPDPAACREPRGELVIHAPWGLRVHAADVAVNLHAHLISGQPPVESYAPWGLSAAPLEGAQVWAVVPCPPDAGGP